MTGFDPPLDLTRTFGDFAHGDFVREYRPLSHSDAVEALDQRNSAQGDPQPYIRLTAETLSVAEFEVFGPDWNGEKSTLVDVRSPHEELSIRAGRVIVRAKSGSFVEIDVEGGTILVLILGAGSRAQVLAQNWSTVFVAAGPGSAGVLQLLGADAVGTITGSSHRFFSRANY